MAKTKLKILAIVLAAILMTLTTQTTLAYYSTVGKATNVITSGNIELKIHEYTGDGSPFPEEGVFVVPGAVVSKRVHVENTCTHPFYLRVRLVNGIDSDVLPYGDLFKINLNETAWTLREDGFIYYGRILQPGETTEAVFSQVEIVGARVDQNYIGRTLSLMVTAHAVQSENNPAEYPWEAQGWPAA